jgi:type IV fimbrial biogenesis protein FimT
MLIGRRGSPTPQGGFSIAEVTMVLAIIAIISTLATPTFLSYYHAAQVRVAAEEVAALLNQGRQLAIERNTSVCVHITATAMHYHLGGCAGATWIGPGTDASGNLKAPQGIGLTTTADPIFSYLGAAATGATYAVTDTQASKTLHVVVAASGRITITP